MCPVGGQRKDNAYRELHDVCVHLELGDKKPDQENVEKGLSAIHDVEAQVLAPPASRGAIGDETVRNERHRYPEDGGDGRYEPVRPDSV